MNKPCPCGSEKYLHECCEPCLRGEKPAVTAEQLMRSRYTAYVMRNEAYILATWHETTRPLQLQTAPSSKWLGLKVISIQAGDAHDTEGHVEFVARYKINGKAYRLHECSRFVREQGRWFYVSGKHK